MLSLAALLLAVTLPPETSAYAEAGEPTDLWLAARAKPPAR
jgi:hypothetical protein